MERWGCKRDESAAAVSNGGVWGNADDDDEDGSKTGMANLGCVFYDFVRLFDVLVYTFFVFIIYAADFVDVAVFVKFLMEEVCAFTLCS